MNKKISNLIKQIICIFLSLIVALPFYMVLINSFKSKGEASRMSLSFPKVLNFNNYLEVIDKGNLLTGFSNSLMYAVIAPTIAILFCSMAAFVINRNKNRITNFAYYYIISGLFIPINYVTLSSLLNKLHLVDSRIGIIITFISSIIPFCTFTISNFISSIPKQLDEAAIIDGANALNLFFKVITPLLKPILVTVFVLQFMGIWNNFITPLYLLSSTSTWPMNLAVYNFMGKNHNYWNYIFADIVLTCVPVIFVYLVGQKYIIGGLTSGAVKE